MSAPFCPCCGAEEPDWNASRATEGWLEENERLRAALESLTEDPEPTLDEPDTDAEVVTKMRAVIDAALNIHKGTET